MINLRNPRFNADGNIDCDLYHSPALGWIPFTAIETDSEAQGREIYKAAMRSNPAPYVAPEPEPVVLTSNDVDAERDRRILDGNKFMISGYGLIRIIGRQVDMSNLTNLAMAAQIMISMNQGATITRFRDDDNIIHDLTQFQILELWTQGSRYVSEIYAAAWSLKDSGPIPEDYAADHHWPLRVQL